MNIHIVVIAYGLDDDLEMLLDCKPSVSSEKNKFHWHLFLHSKIDDVVDVCENAAKRKNVTYYPYGKNRGLAKSWNEGILAGYAAGADVVVVCNDDMLPGEGDIETVARVAMEERGEGNLTCIVKGVLKVAEILHVTTDYGFFAIQPLALETIGMFDEQFVPIYYEDKDYAYRLHISGFESAIASSTNFVHRGSGNINVLPDLANQNTETLAANRAYYVRKWGGEPGVELFEQPFNDLRFSTRIAPCDRLRPYWGKERDDLGIVQI